jgi:hypothetical protein
LLRYFALPDSGITVHIQGKDLSGMQFILKDISLGLPDSLLYEARPATMMSQGDRSVSLHRFALDSLRFRKE